MLNSHAGFTLNVYNVKKRAYCKCFFIPKKTEALQQDYQHSTVIIWPLKAYDLLTNLKNVYLSFKFILWLGNILVLLAKRVNWWSVKNNRVENCFFTLLFLRFQGHELHFMLNSLLFCYCATWCISPHKWRKHPHQFDKKKWMWKMWKKTPKYRHLLQKWKTQPNRNWFPLIYTVWSESLRLLKILWFCVFKSNTIFSLQMIMQT